MSGMGRGFMNLSTNYHWNLKLQSVSNHRSQWKCFVCSPANALLPYVCWLHSSTSSWQLTKNCVQFAKTFSMGGEQYTVVYVICISIVHMYKLVRVISCFSLLLGNLRTNVWHVLSSLDLLATMIHQSNLSTPCQHRMLQSYILDRQLNLPELTSNGSLHVQH